MTDRPSPKVSIAIITYNQIDFLKEAIESCLSQTFQDFEIIIADDGSTDETHEYVTSLAETDHRIVPVLSTTNTGVTSNSNRAFHACSGEFIAWLGGDDLMLPSKLEEQVALMESDPDCALCYHDVEVFESQTGKILRHFNSGPKGLKPREGGAEALLIHGTINCGCATMVRRSACPEYGFDEKIPVASDWLHWIETTRNGSVKFLPKILGRYRRHAGNLTAKPRAGDHEFLLTLGIIEARYPEMVSHTRKRRASLLYTQARRFDRGGNKQLALKNAWEAFRLRPFHMQSILFLGFACFKRFL